MADPRQEHWDRVFSTKPDNMVSWYQHMPETSLRLIRACRLPLDARIVDIGTGASRLPDALLAEGFSNITVLDISPVALAKTKGRGWAAKRPACASSLSMSQNGSPQMVLICGMTGPFCTF